MFGTQHEYFLILQKYFNNSNSSYLKSMKSSKKNILATSLSACLAGLTEATLTPFERVQAVLQMLQKIRSFYTIRCKNFERR